MFTITILHSSYSLHDSLSLKHFFFWTTTAFIVIANYCKISTDSDCCTFAPKIVGKLPKNTVPFPQTIKFRIGGFFRAQKNFCKCVITKSSVAEHCGCKCVRPLWPNRNRMQSNELIFFLCKKSELLLHLLRSNVDLYNQGNIFNIYSDSQESPFASPD